MNRHTERLGFSPSIIPGSPLRDETFFRSNRSGLELFDDVDATDIDVSRHLNNSNTLASMTFEDGEFYRTVFGDAVPKDDISFSGNNISIYEQFRVSHELCKGNQKVLSQVTEFIHICEGALSSSQNSNDQAMRWMAKERDTWKLLYALYNDRMTCSGTEDDFRMLESGCPASEKDVIDDLFRRDDSLRQCQLMIDWLEACEAEKQMGLGNFKLKAEHFTDKTIAWENTILQLQRKPEEVPYVDTNPIVTQIDPDAPLRENRNIHSLDAQDEIRLLSQVLLHIRCGQLEAAQNLCIHCGQPWRAATLEGWRLYHNPNLAPDKPADENILLPIQGNPNRDIWKLAAWRLAEDKRMSDLARTAYGALCGNLEAMLSCMMTWHDWLWAYLRATVDVRVETEIRDQCHRNYVNMPEKYWANKLNLEQIFAALASSPVSSVRFEHVEDHPSVQRFLMLDDMNTLLATLASWSRKKIDLRDPLAAQTIRFAAHLVLILKGLGRGVTDIGLSHGNEVLRSYVHLLMLKGDPVLVMYYMAKLPKSDQVPTLAKFLESIVDPEDKIKSLSLAENAGLDFKSAAQKVVESIRAKESRTGALIRGEATEEDKAKIEALDWLVVYPDQHAEALWQANALVRHFVASGKLDAARAAYAKIPSDIVTHLSKVYDIEPDMSIFSAAQCMSSRPGAAVKEFMCLTLYLEAHQHFTNWLRHLHKERPRSPEPLSKTAKFSEKIAMEHRRKHHETDVARWLSTLKQHAKEAKRLLFSTLLFPNGGWMCPEEDIDIEDTERLSRQRQMESLRSLCLPQVALLIHEVATKSGQPEDSIELANIVASQQYKLYKVFSKEKMRDLLSKLSDTCVELLKNKKDPWGHAVTS